MASFVFSPDFTGDCTSFTTGASVGFFFAFNSSFIFNIFCFNQQWQPVGAALLVCSYQFAVGSCIFSVLSVQSFFTANCRLKTANCQIQQTPAFHQGQCYFNKDSFEVLPGG